MARRRYGRSTVTVSTSHYDEETEVETDVEAACLVTPGSRDSYSRSYGWTPGDPPEVEIVAAVGSDGEDWLERIEEDRSWRSEIEEKALSMAGEYGGPDRVEESRHER